MLNTEDRDWGRRALIALLHIAGDERVNVNTLSRLVMRQGKNGGVFEVYGHGVRTYDLHPVLDWVFEKLVEGGDIYYERDQTHIRVSRHILGYVGAGVVQTFSTNEQEQICLLADHVHSRQEQHSVPAGD